MGDGGMRKRRLSAAACVVAVLWLCAGAFAQAAHGQGLDAKIEKQYQGTLTGSIQLHPDNPNYPYWLKCNTSTYGLVIGHNAEAKALFDEYSGTRISLTGTITEFADGGLAIVPDLPIKRPEPNPALEAVRKVFARNYLNVGYGPSRLVEEILLENGEDLFIFYRQCERDGTLLYQIYSVKNGVLTVLEDSCSMPPFGAWKDWIIVSHNNKRLDMVFRRNYSGRGVTENWIYEHGKLFETHGVSADGECVKLPPDSQIETISGSVYKFDISYMMKSGNTLYMVNPFVWGREEQNTWFSSRVGNWVTLTGKAGGGDYEPWFTPEPPAQEEQPVAPVTVSEKSVLFNNRPFFTSGEDTSLYLLEEIVLGNGDDIFIVGMKTRNKDCPALYKIFSVRSGVCTMTNTFENGEGNPIVTTTAANDAVTITFNRFNPGKGLTEAWMYKEGAVRKVLSEATCSP